jgi:hypothetical protein
MAARAMRLYGVVLTDVAALAVHRLRHWLQMSRIHAARRPAKVIEHQSAGNWPNMLLVGDAMNELRSSALGALAVAPQVNMAKPQPAATIRLRYCVVRNQ